MIWSWDMVGLETDEDGDVYELWRPTHLIDCGTVVCAYVDLPTRVGFVEGEEVFFGTAMQDAIAEVESVHEKRNEQ